MVYLLGGLHTGQYSFGNQVGDAAVEMARPHWLETFRGLQLAFPGCLCCRRCPRLVRPVNAKTLALYLTLTRFAVYFFAGGVYIVLFRNRVMRLLFAAFLVI